MTPFHTQSHTGCNNWEGDNEHIRNLALNISGKQPLIRLGRTRKTMKMSDGIPEGRGQIRSASHWVHIHTLQKSVCLPVTNFLIKVFVFPNHQSPFSDPHAIDLPLLKHNSCAPHALLHPTPLLLLVSSAVPITQPMYISQDIHCSGYSSCPLINHKPQPHCNKQNDSNNEIYALLGHYTAYSSNPVPTFRDKLSAQPSRIKKSNQNAGNNMAEKRKSYLHRGGKAWNHERKQYY
jgi:hypothetical protein